MSLCNGTSRAFGNGPRDEGLTLQTIWYWRLRTAALKRWVAVDHASCSVEPRVADTHQPHPAVVPWNIFEQELDSVVGVRRLVHRSGRRRTLLQSQPHATCRRKFRYELRCRHLMQLQQIQASGFMSPRRFSCSQQTGAREQMCRQSRSGHAHPGAPR